MQITKLSRHNAGNIEVNFMYKKHFEVQEESIKENYFISNIFIIPKKQHGEKLKDKDGNTYLQHHTPKNKYFE